MLQKCLDFLTKKSKANAQKCSRFFNKLFWSKHSKVVPEFHTSSEFNPLTAYSRLVLMCVKKKCIDWSMDSVLLMHLKTLFYGSHFTAIKMRSVQVFYFQNLMRMDLFLLTFWTQDFDGLKSRSSEVFYFQNFKLVDLVLFDAFEQIFWWYQNGTIWSILFLGLQAYGS